MNTPTLDEKLAKIIKRAPNEDGYVEQEDLVAAIAAIHAAYKEARYMTPKEFNKLIEKNADFNKRWNLMTDQEWLARFVAEYDSNEHPMVKDSSIIREQVMQVARRASGVEEKAE